MKNLIFALLSLLFTGPIIYLLPTGLSRAGRIIVACSALLLSLLGNAAVPVFGMLPTTLILFFLTMASAYILDKRYRFQLFETTRFSGEGKERNSLAKRKNMNAELIPTNEMENPPVSVTTVNSSVLLNDALDKLDDHITTEVLENGNEFTALPDVLIPNMDDDIDLLLSRNLDLQDVTEDTETMPQPRIPFLSEGKENVETVVAANDFELEEIDWGLLEAVKNPVLEKSSEDLLV